MKAVKRLRLRISHQDAALILAQGATLRSYKPFAHAFGATKRIADANAALIVTAVNCHTHMVKALQATLRTAQLSSNGSSARLHLALITRYARAALERLES